MEEKMAMWVSSMDEAWSDLESILNRLEKCMVSEDSTAAEWAGLMGEQVAVFERLLRCAKEGRGLAEGEKAAALVEARIAVIESVKKFVVACYEKDTGLKWAWN